MRAGVATATRRAGHRLRRMSPPALLALLCAGAMSPVVTAAVGTVGVAAAGAEILGSVGGNVLSAVLMEAIGRLRPDREPTPADVERVLEEHLEEVLAAGGERAEALRGDIAGVLREIGAARAALEEIVRTGDRETQEQLADAFAQLGRDFREEFDFLLTDLKTAAAEIQDTLQLHGAAQRALSDRGQQQLHLLQVLRQELAVLSERARPGADGPGGRTGTSAGGSWSGGSPYRGLEPFDQAHADVFHGRETSVAELVTMLGARLAGSGLVVVTGPSGARVPA